MATERELFVPLGGMNQDDSYINPSPDGEGHSAFQAGDFRYALNLRTGSTRGDSLGDAENIKSTLPITAYKVWGGSEWIDGVNPLGTNFPRGKREDRQLRSVFYINYNSNGDHTICQYKNKDRTVYELMRWSGLNIQETAYVSMARIGNFLILTDKYNKPRIIDYTTIFSLKYTLGSDFSEYHISFSKWAPVAPPEAIYFAGLISPTLNRDLEKTIAQFSYRYWYVGGFYSAWSPVSNTYSNLYLNGPIAAMILRIPGLIYNSVTPNAPNDHNDPSFYRVVQFIEIAYRANQLDTWKSYKKWPVLISGGGAPPLTIPFTGVDNTLFEFNGKVIGTPISPQIFAQDFDDVPLLSGCCEVIDNRTMFGNNLEEHEFVEDVDFVEEVTVYETTSAAWAADLSGFFSGLATGSDAELLLIGRNTLSRQSFKSRGVYKFGIEFKDETGKKSLIYTTDAWIVTIPDNTPRTSFTEPFYAVGWNLKDDFSPPEWATSYQIVRTNCLNINYFLYGFVNRFTLLKDDVTVVTDQVTNSEDTQKVIRDFFDSQTKEFSLAARLGAQTRKTKTTSTLGDASRIYIDINNWANAAAQDGPTRTKDFPLNKLYYNFQDGDRVRFFGSGISASPTADQIRIYDVPVLEFTGRAIIVEKPSGILWVPTTSDSEDKLIVEVYRPVIELKKEDLVYYEMGEWYPITNPKSGGRDFLKRDWRWTDETQVTADSYKGHYAYSKLPCYAGDCHMIIRDYYYDYFSAGQNGVVLDVTGPSMNPDKDFVYGRWEKNNGRINTAYEVKPIVDFKLSQIKFGGKYLQDALFNNLNNFRPLDQFLYPQEYGTIHEMCNTTSYQVESVGSILLVLASIKPFSVYVNRTTLEDLGGRTQFFLSDKVLGSYNSLLGDNGCINPESISTSTNGNIYWWDQFNGCWVRYGRDGNTDISGTFKMDNWFKEMAELIDAYYDTDTPPRIISEFDQFHKELIVYITHPSLPDSFRGYDDYKGMVFNEKRNEWKFAHNYDAEIFLKVNNNVFGIKTGALHLHEGGTDYGSFYGTKYPIKLEPVFNKTPHANKIWQTISEIASHPWSIERTLSEYFGSRDYQESSLALTKLTEKEFTFHSELMGDANTPNFTDAELAVATGNKLRSKVLRVLLRLDDTVVVRSLLHQVIIGYIDSPKNG